MGNFIATFIPCALNGFICYWIGLLMGGRDKDKFRAFVKLRKDGNSATIHSKTAHDDIKMILAICARLENEGYAMQCVVDALAETVLENDSEVNE